MSKKMKIPSIFRRKEAKHPWQCPSCKNPQTLSFRAAKPDDAIFKTVNSAFLETPESWFTNSSECASNFSTDERSDENNNSNSNDDGNNNGPESLEMIIREVRSSERLFFEPGETSSMILKEEKPSSSSHAVALLPFKGSVALALESEDPCLDFKKSMQEMVESHGLRDWERLEELLGWYLKMNGKMNHGFILGAFVDLLVGLSPNDSSTSSSTALCHTDLTCYSSADSCFSSHSSPLSPAVAGGDDDDDQTGIDQEGENVIRQP